MQSLTHSLPCNHIRRAVPFMHGGVHLRRRVLGDQLTMRPRLWSKKHGESRAVSEHYPAGGTTHARPCYVTLYGHACPEGPRGPALSVKTFV